MVGKLTGEVVTKEELYEAAWATDCGLSMSKYAEAYQINRSSADCLQRKFLTALARVLFPEIQAFFESEEGQREFAEWKAQQGKSKGYRRRECFIHSRLLYPSKIPT